MVFMHNSPFISNPHVARDIVVKTAKRLRTALGAALLMTAVSFGAFAQGEKEAAEAQDGDASFTIAVVVHPEVDVDELSMPELRRILLGDRQFWHAGQRITLVVRAPVARERDILLKKVYQMSEAQFRHYWIAKVFRAESPSGPKVVLSSEMTEELVRAIGGAIALLHADRVPEDLKVLKIAGYAPTDPDYPLRGEEKP